MIKTLLFTKIWMKLVSMMSVFCLRDTVLYFVTSVRFTNYLHAHNPLLGQVHSRVHTTVTLCQVVRGCHTVLTEARTTPSHSGWAEKIPEIARNYLCSLPLMYSQHIQRALARCCTLSTFTRTKPDDDVKTWSLLTSFIYLHVHIVIPMLQKCLKDKHYFLSFSHCLFFLDLYMYMLYDIY